MFPPRCPDFYPLSIYVQQEPYLHVAFSRLKTVTYSYFDTLYANELERNWIFNGENSLFQLSMSKKVLVTDYMMSLSYSP